MAIFPEIQYHKNFPAVGLHLQTPVCDILVLKNDQNVIQMTLKWLFFQEIATIAQGLGLCLYTRIAPVCSTCHPIATFFEQNHFNFWF